MTLARTPLIQRPFPTHTSNVATGTTLAAATRYEFAAETLHAPQTTGRANWEALVRVSFRINGTAAVDLDGLRIGIAIDGGAFDDEDTTYAVADTGEHFHVEATRRVSAVFEAQDPGTASFDVEVAVAVATEAADQVMNLTARIDYSYDFDDTATTVIRTVENGIQSHYTSIGTSYVELGCAGGTSDAPVNQIRQLTGAGGQFDGVDGFALLSRHLLLVGMDNIAGAGDVTPSIRFDGGVDIPLGVLSSALVSNCGWQHTIDIGPSGQNLSLTAAHSLEMLSDVTSRMECVGAIDVVTYSCDESSDVHVVSVRVPLVNENSDFISYLTSTTSAVQDRLTAVLDVQEPDTIEMDRVCVVVQDSQASNTQSLYLGATGQSQRPYVHSNTIRDGNRHLIHRCDHSTSDWTLVRGVNKLHLNTFQTSAINSAMTGYAIINYRCGRHPGGAHHHTRTVCNQVTAFNTSTVISTQTPAPLAIPEANYSLGGSFVLAYPFINAVGGLAVRAARLAGEDGEGGWWHSFMPANASFTEVGTSVFVFPTTTWWRKRPGLSTAGGDIEASRDWMSRLNTTAAHHAADHYVTYHSMTFTVSGVVTIDDVIVATSNVVDIYAVDADGNAELVSADESTIFSVEVPDNTRTYHAVLRDSGGGYYGRSADGTPGVDDFSIAHYTGAGGAGHFTLGQVLGGVSI